MTDRPSPETAPSIGDMYKLRECLRCGIARFDVRGGTEWAHDLCAHCRREAVQPELPLTIVTI